MNKNITKLFCSSKTTIKQVLKKFEIASENNLPSGIALFVNNKDILKGVISEGDIRRALLKGSNLDSPAQSHMTSSPIVFDSNKSVTEILHELPKELNLRGRKSSKFLDKIVLTDKKGIPVKIISYHELWEQKVATHRNITIVGMGYVGLTLAIVMADSGFNIVGVEVDVKKLNLLKAGRPHIHENGLTEILNENLNKNLNFKSEIPNSDVFIISVGTPISNNNEPNLSYLKKSCEEVGAKLKQGNLVILRSTVPVGVTRKTAKTILEKISGLVCGIDFHLSFAPERTAEGSALKELRSLPQIIGGFDNDSVNATSAIFRDITSTIVTVESLEEAEMVKLINNSFRDYIFAFSNQVAKLSSKFNINAHKLITYSNEGYVRDKIPYPSPGVGGPCLTKDPYIFSYVAKKASIDQNFFSNSRIVNESMHIFVYSKVIESLKIVDKKLKEINILFCGLAFKGNPETGDIRDSTSLEIAKLFKKENSNLYAFDSVASKKEINSEGFTFHNINLGFNKFDVVLFLNNHKSFEKINEFEMVRSMKEKPIIFDGWNLFHYHDILSCRPSIYIGLSDIKESISNLKI